MKLYTIPQIKITHLKLEPILNHGSNFPGNGHHYGHDKHKNAVYYNDEYEEEII